MDSVVRYGLKLVVWLHFIGNEATQLSAVQEYLSVNHSLDASIQTLLSSYTQFERRDIFVPYERDDAEASQVVMEFPGDEVPLRGPPLGWVLLWGGIYANLYGEHVPKTVRNWGYVFWDEHRWDSEAEEIFVNHWYVKL